MIDNISTNNFKKALNGKTPGAVKRISATGRRVCVLGRCLILIIFTILMVPAMAQAGWYDANWSNRQKITILPTLADADLTNFPYLVKITDSANPIYSIPQTDGDDILFTAADGTTKLNHEIEKYNPATYELYIWVQVPTISGTLNTDIYMYYGNGSATSQQSVAATWDNDFVMVQHLQETSGTHFDSTSQNNDGTPQNGVVQTATGKIDGADTFDGVNDYVNVPDSTSLRVVAMTLEAWVRIPAPLPSSGYHGILNHGIDGNANWYLLSYDGSINRFHYRWSIGSVRRTNFAATVSADTWYYVVGVLNAGTTTAYTYLNGGLDTTVTGASLPTATASTLDIGRSLSSELFKGTIDEVRISKVARTPEWISASFRNQNTPDTYQTLEPQQDPPSLWIGGRIFEDKNYGGGAGRSLAASSGVGRPGARVELYDASGAFVDSSTTNAQGDYTLGISSSGNYTVRVVNATVRSSRTGSDGTELSVQTFRTDASSGTAAPVTDKVGGEQPQQVDAPVNNGSQSLATLQALPGQYTQSIALVSVAAANITGVDFGFNFDTIVNTNTADQGSLRQFIRNANRLTDDATLDQAGRTPGRETSIFMIPTTDTGYSAAPLAYTIRPTAVLDDITDPVILDGTTQPGFSGSPIIEIDGTSVAVGDENGLTLQAGNSVVRGFVINRFLSDGIEIEIGGTNVVEGNYFGTDVAGTAARPNGYGISVKSNGNVIGGTTGSQRNVISGNTGWGIGLYSLGSSNIIEGNYIGLKADGSAGLGNSGNGIEIDDTVLNNTIESNVITANAKGVAVITGTGNAILQNAIYANTSLGIDLRNDGVTNNNGGKDAGRANYEMDFPVFSNAKLAGTSLDVSGYVGSAPNDTDFANVRVEIFKSDIDPTGYGEGQTYLGYVTTDASGNFSGTLTVSGLAVGDRITGTATDTIDNTSEFGANVAVQAHPCPGWAVTTTADSGVPGTLRECVKEANKFSGITLSVPAGTYTLAIVGQGEDAAATGDLDITASMTINGAGAGSTIIQAGTNATNGIDRVFHLLADTTLSDLTIQFGNLGTGVEGGGIYIDNAAVVTLAELAVQNNTGKHGGGIYNKNGTLTVTESTISGNSAANGHGGGLYHDGGTTATLTNVTISGNSATQDGGGTYSNDPLTLVNVTLASNTATGKGGGIRRNGGTTSLKNTIVANNSASTSLNCEGTITSAGYNLDSGNSCLFTGTGDQINTDPLLGTLQDNGGPTLTHALALLSSAVDAGTNSGAPASDQRGQPRPYDGDGDSIAVTDIGAYESQQTSDNVSGNVYEDVNGDADLADKVVSTGVRVRLYADANDNGVVDAGDTFIREKSTDASGHYSLQLDTATTGFKYLVAVDSRGVVPSGGFNVGFGQGDVWAEQTYGDNPASVFLDLGARIGGRTVGTSDAFNTASSAPGNNAYQHLARVDVSGGNVAGVDFAFSFRVISHPADRNDDAGANRTAQGTLRQAIQNANAIVGAPVLNVPTDTYTLAIAGTGEDGTRTGDLDVTDAVTLVGAGAPTTIINGNNIDRVFHLFANTTVSGVTVQGGNLGTSTEGGGIYIDNAAVVNLTEVAVKSNTGKHGGGIYNKNGMLTVTESTISGNSAANGQGGGLFHDASTTVTLTNVTFSGNSATSDGGGIHAKDPVTLTNVTLANNSAGNKGGGIRREGGTASLKNTIVANNTATGGDPNCTGTITSAGYNLDSGNSCLFTGTGDKINTNPLLGALQDNGGPTFTHALTTTSPAIDTGTSTGAPATDQRGVARPIDGDGNGSALFDIGAYEAGQLGVTVKGTVFEDANFAGTAAEYDGGASDLALANVDVELYDAADTYITSVTTDATGGYSFTGLANGTYKVRVRSATVGDADTPPKAGLNATVPGTWPYPLAELAWANGGALYGGQDPTADDTATGDNAGPGDTYVTLTVNSDVSGVNFGFAFNLIVNTGDDTNADTVRSKQGSLRQFIKNANAIGTAGGTTANISQFRIPNGLLDGNGVASIAPLAALPNINDATGGTAIDGFTQTTNQGDTNSLGPEVEIRGFPTSFTYGLELNSANNTVKGLIINSFSGGQSAGIMITGASATGNTVTGNYLGTNYSGTAAVTNYIGVAIGAGAQSNTVGGTSDAERNVISGNSTYGAEIKDSGTDLNVVKGNYIGTDRLGTTAVANGTGAIIWAGAANNTIGGNAVDAGNVISGSTSNGLIIANPGSDNNVVQGNLIGTDAAGTGNLGNGSSGININQGALNNTIGGTATREANTIAFNSGDGISMNSSGTDGNKVSGNAIFQNGGLGIDLDPDGVGTGSGANNDKAAPSITSITPSGSDFTIIATAGNSDTIEFFRVNNTAAPAVTADPSGSGEGYLYLGSCVDNGACSGPHISAVADVDPAAGSVQAVLLSSGLNGTDVVTATATDTSNNTSEFAVNAYTSTCPGGVVTTTADAGFASLRECINLANSNPGTTISFNIPGPGNQSAGADSWWRISPTSALPTVTAAGTIIDATTQTVNQGDTNSQGPEIELNGGGAGASIRGLTIAGGNSTVRGLVINRFTLDGIYLVSFGGNVIEGNYIGTNATGTTDLGNSGSGVYVHSSTGNTIGGSSPGAGNLISGNDYNASQWTTGRGVMLYDADGNTVIGNYIGTDITGTVSIGNEREGVGISNCINNTVGGSGVGEENLISGNSGEGVWIGGGGTTGNRVLGNIIGTQIDGTSPLGNGSHGVAISNTATNNSIGGSGTGDGNVIAYNTNDGVWIDGSMTDFNLISGNAIFENGGLGIDLESDGVGATGGANNNKAAPVITSIIASGSDYTIISTADNGDTVEFFRVNNAAAPTVTADASGSGEGYLYLGSCLDNGACSGPHISPVADADPVAGSIRAVLLSSGVSVGDRVSATATDSSNNTSEFSVNALAQGAADLALTKMDNPDPAPAGGPLVYTLSVTNNGPTTANNVTLVDTLPAGVTFQSATPSQGSCSGTTTVTCNMGSVFNGGTASVEILVVTSGAGTITNTASVTADENDPVPGNNNASEDTDVTVSPMFDVPLTQYARLHGFIDYITTGGSLRTQPNSINACSVTGSSTAALSGIPAGGSVLAAYLYWAGSGSTVDSQVTLDGAPLTADRTFTSRFVLSPNNFDFFGGFKDVTAAVQAKRNGNYTFSGLTVDTTGQYCSLQAVIAGWSLIVIYEDSAASGKTLVVYDGFDLERNNSTSYLLSGIHAVAPTEAKTSFLLWEGDESLGGVQELLRFNGTNLSDALNPINNVYNGTINTLPTTTAYGVDLDTFDVSSRVSDGDTSASNTVSVGPDLVILNAVVLEAKTDIIVGYVFDDVNYGGGAGRNFTTAVAAAPGFSVGRPGARAELYNGAGNFLRATTTDLNGRYGFAGIPNGNYFVRVVNETVTPARSAATGSEWPVQTFRTNASTGTPVDVTSEVGGNNPAVQDDPANTTSANLFSITAQSVAPVTIGDHLSVFNVDFGFNFDTIVNTNPSGQGSLREFIENANALSNTGLAQAGMTAGIENSIFMIPGAGPYTIQPATAFPTVTDPVVLDGTTQPGWTSAPIIELNGNMTVADGLTITASGSTIRGLVINRFTTSGIDITAGSGNTIVGNYIGTDMAGMAQAGNNTQGILITSSTGNTIGGTNAADRNVISGNRQRGILIFESAASGNQVFGNYIGTNAAGTATLTNQQMGIYLWNTPNNVIGGTAADAGNLISGNTWHGVYAWGANATGNFIQGNTIGLDVNQAVAIPNGDSLTRSGIAISSAPGNTIGGAAAGAENVIAGNTGRGIIISGVDATGNLIQSNAIYGNGSIGIDLALDGVTANDDAKTAGQPNLLMDFPVFTASTLLGTNLYVAGYVGLTPDQATFANARVEIFEADNDASGHGEGQTFLGFLTTDGNGNFSGTIDVSGKGLATGENITGTATDGSNNTSEFGTHRIVVTPAVTIEDVTEIEGTGLLFTVTPGQCSRRRHSMSPSASPMARPPAEQRPWRSRKIMPMTP